MSLAGHSALILGATGQTGQYILKELLSSSHFTRVSEYGRRVTSLESLSTGKDKLEQKTIDFEKLEESGLKEGTWDVVFVACVCPFRYISANSDLDVVDSLGTTRSAAGSAEMFEKIDRECVLHSTLYFLLFLKFAMCRQICGQCSPRSEVSQSRPPSTSGLCFR